MRQTVTGLPHEFFIPANLISSKDEDVGGKGGGLVVCEKYRISLMALVDGELADPERAEIEEHLAHCVYCNEEYNDILYMNQTTSEVLSLVMPLVNASANAAPWENYYQGVCRKLETRASWAAWSLVSLLLVIAGTLMIFGCQGAALAVLAGTIALGAGAALMVVSYFCNCCSK